jgi:hypothetical protein
MLGAVGSTVCGIVGTMGELGIATGELAGVIGRSGTSMRVGTEIGDEGAGPLAV